MRTPLFVSWLLVLIVCVTADAATAQAGRATKPPPVDPRVVQSYAKQLGDADQRTRLIAADALRALGPEAASAVPALIQMAETATDNTEKIAAAMALAQMGPEAKPAIPALRRMAASFDGNVSKVANLAIEGIDPPATTRAWAYVSSTYGMAAVVAIGAGLIALFVLVRRREPSSLDREPTTPKPAAKPAAEKPVAAPAAKSATAPQVVNPPAAKVQRQLKHRARVSRPLPSHASYVQEQEGPDSVKRDLFRAQEELKRVSNLQKDLAKYFDQDEVKRDPERMRQLRKDVDEYSLEHYRAEVRVKALEVKMLEVLLGNAKTGDQELRERSEATLRQKWDELRVFCEAPTKVLWQSGTWTRSANGPRRKIKDLRAHLLELDVTLPEHLIGLPEIDDAGPSTPSAPEPPLEVDLAPAVDEKVEPEEIELPQAEVPAESEALEPEEIELLQAEDDLDPEEIAAIKAEAERLGEQAIASESLADGPVAEAPASTENQADEPASH